MTVLDNGLVVLLVLLYIYRVLTLLFSPLATIRILKKMHFNLIMKIAQLCFNTGKMVLDPIYLEG